MWSQRVLIFLIAWRRPAMRDMVHFITEKSLKKTIGSLLKVKKILHEFSLKKVFMPKMSGPSWKIVLVILAKIFRALICIFYLNSKRLLMGIWPVFIIFM